MDASGSQKGRDLGLAGSVHLEASDHQQSEDHEEYDGQRGRSGMSGNAATTAPLGVVVVGGLEELGEVSQGVDVEVDEAVHLRRCEDHRIGGVLIGKEIDTVCRHSKLEPVPRNVGERIGVEVASHPHGAERTKAKTFVLDVDVGTGVEGDAATAGHVKVVRGGGVEVHHRAVVQVPDHIRSGSDHVHVLVVSSRDFHLDDFFAEGGLARDRAALRESRGLLVPLEGGALEVGVIDRSQDGHHSVLVACILKRAIGGFTFAGVAVFDLTSTAAAVPSCGVVVVTLLAVVNDTVATHRNFVRAGAGVEGAGRRTGQGPAVESLALAGFPTELRVVALLAELQSVVTTRGAERGVERTGSGGATQLAAIESEGFAGLAIVVSITVFAGIDIAVPAGGGHALSRDEVAVGVAGQGPGRESEIRAVLAVEIAAITVLAAVDRSVAAIVVAVDGIDGAGAGTGQRATVEPEGLTGGGAEVRTVTSFPGLLGAVGAHRSGHGGGEPGDCVSSSGVNRRIGLLDAAHVPGPDVEVRSVGAGSVQSGVVDGDIGACIARHSVVRGGGGDRNEVCRVSIHRTHTEMSGGQLDPTGSGRESLPEGGSSIQRDWNRVDAGEAGHVQEVVPGVILHVADHVSHHTANAVSGRSGIGGRDGADVSADRVDHVDGGTIVSDVLRVVAGKRNRSEAGTGQVNLFHAVISRRGHVGIPIENGAIAHGLTNVKSVKRFVGDIVRADDRVFASDEEESLSGGHSAGSRTNTGDGAGKSSIVEVKVDRARVRADRETTLGCAVRHGGLCGLDVDKKGYSHEGHEGKEFLRHGVVSFYFSCEKLFPRFRVLTNVRF